jgi:predicted ribosome quality control (RQC) complex YloA/Tae2 family protein
VFDVLTVAAVADELTETILDGRVQKVGMISRLALGFEVYAGRRRRYLIVSAENDDPRIMLLEREPSFDSQLVTPLLLLLRKYVRGGLIVGIEQPPLDRVVRLSIAKRLEPHNDAPAPEPSEEVDEEDPEGLEDATFVHLVVEIMGRHSNIIMVDDDGRIMEAAKRVTPSMSRVRPIAPRLPYTEPPIGDRGDPRKLSTAEAGILLAGEKPSASLATVLPRRLRGVSPQMAREVAFRSFGSANAMVAAATGEGAGTLAREMRRLLEPLLTSTWAPQVYRQEGEPVAFAATPHEHLVARYEVEAVPSVSRAAEIASGAEGAETPAKHSQRRQRLIQAVLEARGRVETRRERLLQEAAKSEEADKLRVWGELIYGYLWAIQPGQRELDVDGVKVPLDPALSAKEYFERYRKAQSAGEHVPALIAEADLEIAYLEQLETLAEQAMTFPELEEVAIEWETHQRAREGAAGGRTKIKRSTPPRRTKPLVDRNGNLIYIGRSGAENDRIAFDIAGPNDTWLHARGAPGSHVLVRWSNPAGDEEDDTLETAAALAAYYSRRRESGNVEVDITRRRHVRKIKGAGPGMVTYRNERTVAVKPKSESELGSRLERS